MKILWLAHEGHISGANLCLLENLGLLKENNIENFLIIPYGGEALAKRATALNIPVKFVKFYSWTRPLSVSHFSFSFRIKRALRNYLAVKEIRQLIEKIRPDFVATNTVVSPVAALAAFKAKCPHVWFIHEFGEEDHGFVIGDGFNRSASVMSQLSVRMAFNSLSTRKKYQPFVPDEKAFIVNNAVVMPGRNITMRKNESILKLVMLGQVAPSKNHLEALTSMAIVKSIGLECRLTIIGRAEDDTYLAKLKHFVTDNKLQDLVEFAGASNAPFGLLLQHHAMLMCSHLEAFGRVTVEALKCGLPVIAANTGGSLEIIQDGANGYFYEAGNAEDLANKIILLKNNYYLFDHQRIADQAMQEFNESKTTSQLMRVFNIHV